jgi:hypothetical protein
VRVVGTTPPTPERYAIGTGSTTFTIAAPPKPTPPPTPPTPPPPPTPPSNCSPLVVVPSIPICVPTSVFGGVAAFFRSVPGATEYKFEFQVYGGTAAGTYTPTFAASEVVTGVYSDIDGPQCVRNANDIWSYVTWLGPSPWTNGATEVHYRVHVGGCTVYSNEVTTTFEFVSCSTHGFCGGNMCAYCAPQ